MALTLLLGIILGQSLGHAQLTPSTTNAGSANQQDVPVATRAGATIHVTILDENNKPLNQQAIIRLTDQETGRVFFQTARGSKVDLNDIPRAKYLIEVGAAGYLGKHAQIEVTDIFYDLYEKVVLVHDPASVELKLNDTSQLPSKARKEAEKGLQELQLSNFSQAHKHLEAANHQYPSSSSLNFLLGYLAMQQGDQEHALAYLTDSTKLDPKNVQAQNLLGQLYYRRADYAHAAEAEQIVVASSGESLIARKVLASSCLSLKQFEKARENSQWIVDHGGSDGASARLILGQALAGLRQNDAAIQTLTAYLDGNPDSSVAPHVRELIDHLRKQASPGAAAKSSSGIADPELAADAESTAGMPPDVDDEKPSLAPGIPCPANILEMTAEPSKRLVDNIAQFSAIEHMVHEDLSPQGTPKTRQTREFNYVAAISQTGLESLIVDEYRDSENMEMPDKITTTGLAVLAIAFHPFFHGDFDMHCEGLGDWDGQAAWLVHFRQLTQRPNRLRAYVVNKVSYPVWLKGRAWILADNFQIVHLETDLLQPIPQIRLASEHTSITYGPVQFKRTNTDLWLPKNAELYVRIGKLRFRRTESFDHFMLFATDATEKTKLPVSDASPGAADNGGSVRPE